MPTVKDHHDGQPCWVDLTSADPGVARTFYAGLLGWEIEVFGEEFGYYSIARKDGEDVAGIGPIPANAPMPSTWNLYLWASDVDERFAAALAAGATALMPEPMDVPGTGRMATVLDPSGAAIGLWQTHGMDGFAVAGEPGAFAWAEQWSRDVPAAEAFYTTLFGYGVHDMSDGGFVYKTLRIGDDEVAGFGLMDPSWGEVAPHWSVYFAVDDADAAVARAIELGGATHGTPMDSPYGRLASVIDPLGAPFRVIATP